MMTFLAPIFMWLEGHHFGGGEDTGALDDVLGSGSLPVDVGGVLLAEHVDLGTVDVQKLAIVLHLAFESSVGGVILEHVDHVVERDEGIVDGDDLGALGDG